MSYLDTTRDVRHEARRHEALQLAINFRAEHLPENLIKTAQLIESYLREGTTEGEKNERTTVQAAA